MVEENIAIVFGEPFCELPKDLYIPPQALRVFLGTFSGPLDLLLYLIKKQNIDILDIPIAKITTQYVEYLELMQELKIELAAEYLVMAAMLAEIKSKLLLPRLDIEEIEDADPRAELVRRLQEYERYKKVADDLDKLPRQERDIFTLAVEIPQLPTAVKKLPQIELQDLMLAFKSVLQRTAVYSHHKIRMDNISVRERMSRILDKLRDNKTLGFTEFFEVDEVKLGVVVTFLALLELLREGVIAITQAENFSNIYVQKKISGNQ